MQKIISFLSFSRLEKETKINLNTKEEWKKENIKFLVNEVSTQKENMKNFLDIWKIIIFPLEKVTEIFDRKKYMSAKYGKTWLCGLRDGP
jgi:hypothetical protein